MVAIERAHRGRDWLVLVGFGLAAFAAAAIGGLGISGTGQEYASLERPAWAPPSWLFGPVWTVLYATIAIAGWLVWRRVGWSWPLVPYAVQLVLNAAWTPIFFGLGAYGLAAVDVVLLWAAIGATVASFWRVHRGAAVLLLPYWAWVSYATALTIAIWRLN
ncbi:TspO/MBR family protein [Luedemannella helvata]|uniref:Tryptophan-rich sensory protein n=1 Tax=Luedemannella helvata TaxID=349315 RepID=A0ABP4WW00_9ACTN